MRRIKWVCLIFLIVVAVGGFCAWFFQVKKITVEGNTFYDDARVASFFDTGYADENTILYFIREHFGAKKQIPFVREYEVSFPKYNEVHIKIYEKSIVAGVSYMSQYLYFDKDGMILESTKKRMEHVPVFEISSMKSFSLYDTLQMEDKTLLEEIMDIANLMSHYGIEGEKVTFNNKKEAVLYTGNIKVVLGKSSDYDDAIAALKSVLETAKQQNFAGEIDLANYKAGDNVILKQNVTQ